MIISASRRTDIPAFYSDWFFNRWRAGSVLVRNPVNPRRVSRVPLTPDTVDGVVFWTKNPAPLLAAHAHELLNLSVPFYFQFTLNAYGPELEPGVPEPRKVLKTFVGLSRLVGRERVIWRYDPIIVSDRLTVDWHFRRFSRLATELAPHAEQCIISFLDLYRKTRRQLGQRAGILSEPGGAEELTAQLELGHRLHTVAAAAGLTLSACAERPELAQFGISPARCIDPGLIARLAGRPVTVGKARGQRRECGCADSADIGAYDTCPHGCRYCYANFSPAAGRSRNHDPGSELLTGHLGPDDRVTGRSGGGDAVRQLTLW